jgi:hypothetical protein
LVGEEKHTAPGCAAPVTSEAHSVASTKAAHPSGSHVSTVFAQVLYALNEASVLTGQLAAQAACSHSTTASKFDAQAVLHGSSRRRQPPKLGDTTPFELRTAAPQEGADASLKRQLKQANPELDALDSGHVPPPRQSL